MARGIYSIGVLIICVVAIELSHALLRKVFKRHPEHYKPHPMHLQADNGEQVPNSDVKMLVQEYRMLIKEQANLDTQPGELEDAEIEPLSFITYKEALRTTIYLIKVIIENQYIVHVKISVSRTGTPRLEVVLTNKEEVDKLNKTEFGE